MKKITYKKMFVYNYLIFKQKIIKTAIDFTYNSLHIYLIILQLGG